MREETTRAMLWWCWSAATTARTLFRCGSRIILIHRPDGPTGASTSCA